MPDNNKNENDLLSIGKSYFEKEKYKEAIKILSELVVKLNPDNAEAWYYLGASYYNDRQVEKGKETKKSILKAIELNPNDNNYYWLGRLCYFSYDDDEGIKYISKAIELNPNNYDNYYWLGELYYDKEEYKEALQSFLKTYELNPEKIECLERLTELYSKNGEHDKAIEYLLKAIELNPDEPDNYWELGWLYEKNNQKEEAFKSFMKSNYHKNWVDFYKEFANKLLEFKNKRKELIEIIKSTPNINFPKIDDIDPFTVFGLLNGQGWDFRENMIKYISDKFKITSKLTKWFWVSPYYNFNRIFYNPSQNDKNDIENLWNFFETAINYADNNNIENKEKFIKAYNVAKDIKGNKWKLTIGLHWIRPFNYINLDITSRKFIIENNIIPDYANYLSDNSTINGEEYLQICDKLLEAIKNDKYQFKDLLELSFFASIIGYTRISSYIKENSNQSVKYDNNNDKDDLLSIAENYFENGEYDEAIKIFLELLELNPNDNYILYMLAYCYEEKRQYKEALKYFLKANKDWIEFYKEFANKLLEFKNNRKELINKLKSVFEYINIKTPKIFEEKDIDPFTIFGLFNKGMSDRMDIINGIADKFQIASVVPLDFYRVPVLFPLSAILFNTADKSKNEDIKNLWNVFETAINYADNNTNENREAFINAFDLAKDIKGNKWKLTQVLYWIRPFNYINLDNVSRKFIIENKIIPDYNKYLSDTNKSMINGEEYLTICDKLIEAINNNNYEFKDFPELSFSAYYTVNIIQKNTDNINNKEGNTMNIENNFNNSNKYDKNKFLQEVYITEEEYDKLVKLITEKKNIILQGSAGVGKTYAAKRLAYSIIGEKDKERVEMIQFHQSYSYEDFIMGYRPNENGFELKEGIFYKLCKEAEEDGGNKYFLIIDEINRGNISKIFGELFMLIENDKRGEEEALELIYTNEKFSVPENLYIIGLMNTADRSLAMLDYALRRRFAFYDMKPAFDSEQFEEYKNKLNNKRFNSLIEKIKELNKVISEDGSLGEGFCIGHSYFCNLEDIKDDKTMFDKLSLIIEFELIPLLKEYWFDDKDKVNKWEAELGKSIE